MKIQYTLAIAITCAVAIVINCCIRQEMSARAQVSAPTGENVRQPQYTSFATAGIKLIRPDGFETAESFDGFQQPSTQSSVMAITIPGPFAEVTKGFTSEGLKARGMTLKSRENISIDGSEGILINLTQTASGIEFAKWIVAFGNQKETKVVTATFPKAEAAQLSLVLRSVVLTAKNDTTPPPILGSDVGFKIGASNRLKLARVVGKMLLYTRDGTIPAKSPVDPLFIVARSFSEVSIIDKKEFATRRLFQTNTTKVSSIISTTKIAIAGLDGYEIVAEAKDATSDTPITVYQVMLFDGRSYILIQGMVGSKISNDYLPEFKVMARSFTKASN